LNDGSGTPVARYHRKRFGIIGKARKPCLEILEAGKGIADEIVVTFAYVEKLRMDRERAVRSG
jgi:hypothetical protein